MPSRIGIRQLGFGLDDVGSQAGACSVWGQLYWPVSNAPLLAFLVLVDTVASGTGRLAGEEVVSDVLCVICEMGGFLFSLGLKRVHNSADSRRFAPSR